LKPVPDDSCVRNNQCRRGNICMNGRCVSVCEDNSQCALKHVCLNKVCVRIPEVCKSNEECRAPKNICSGGNCVAGFIPGA
jgi:hypothetical protein